MRSAACALFVGGLFAEDPAVELAGLLVGFLGLDAFGTEAAGADDAFVAAGGGEDEGGKRGEAEEASGARWSTGSRHDVRVGVDRSLRRGRYQGEEWSRNHKKPSRARRPRGMMSRHDRWVARRSTGAPHSGQCRVLSR